MNPEGVSKPDMSQERAQQLGRDGLELKNRLEERRRWLVSEKQKTLPSNRKNIIDEEISRIAQVFENVRASESEYTEDAALRFLHEAAQILGDKRYAGTADILPFEKKK